jgi:type IX secretion system PorP/SprF family membrane protein
VFFINTSLFAQQLVSHSQFFLNPYVYNPALVGTSGYNEIYFTHRQQWLGIEGAPATSSVSIHLPTPGKVAFGFNIYNDKRGLLSTSAALFTVGYTAQLGKEHYLRGGLSGGLGMNGIQLDKVENINDPALNNVSRNNLFLDGNIGLNYQCKNLNLGVALPKIFQRNVISTTSFNEIEVKRLDHFLFTASYKFNFADGAIAFEPQALYHVTEGSPNRYEALGVVYLRDILWFGGSYRQYNGPTAFAGIKVTKQIKFGYAFDMSTSQITGFGNSSHEMMLSLRFGQNRKANSKKTFPAANKNITGNKKENTQAISGETKPKAKDEVMERELAKMPDATKAPKADRKNQQQPALEPEIRSTAKEDFTTPEESRTDNSKIEEKIKAQKREHPMELEKGHYVVVNAFRVFDNVIKYHEELSDKFENSQFGYSTSSMYYYSYVLRTTDLNRARFERNKLRKLKGYENTWVLTIE